MRLIDADALKKDLTRFYDNEVTAKRLIDEQPTIEPEPHWIKCSERLPEFRKEVLTCGNGGFIEIQSLEDSCADIYWENQKGDWSNIDEVIAWMSLPPCYKPQERSGEE